MKELMERGFFEANGVLSRFTGSSQYTVRESDGTLIVERSFTGSDDTKNRVLDYIQSLAGRYALTQAQIRGGSLRIFLTKPGVNAREEAIRIDFLIQSAEAGISEIQREFAEESLPEDITAVKGFGPTDDSTAAGVNAGQPQTEPADRAFPLEASSSRTAPVTRDLYRENYLPNPDQVLYEEEVRDDDEFYKYKGNPTELENTARFHFPKEVVQAPRKRSHNNYTPPASNHYTGKDPEPVYATVVDRRYSFLGIFAAALGTFLGAIVIGVVGTMGYPGQAAGILVPFFIIGVYRLISGHQMPIWLAVFFILCSLFLGSVLLATSDILAQNNPGFVVALKQGVLAHFDNKTYYVGNVWLKYGLSVLAASIPAMLLLAAGKHKTKVY